MAKKNPSLSFYLFVAFTFLLALLISILPVARELALYRPEFVCLLCVYWVLYAPEKVGVGIAWSVGFLADVVEGSVWGGHAIALAILAYICLHSYQRLRSYPLWQQGLWAFVFLGIHQVIVSWVQGMEGYSYPLFFMLAPALASAICWPLVVVGMQRLRSRYSVI